MKSTLQRSLLLLLALDLTVPAFGADISGRWTAPFNREGTPVTIVMNLKVSGSDVTGTITTPRGQELKIENGKLEGDKLTFETNIEGPNGRKFNPHYTGEIKEDAIKMTTEINGQPGGQPINFHRADKWSMSVPSEDRTRRWLRTDARASRHLSLTRFSFVSKEVPKDAPNDFALAPGRTNLDAQAATGAVLRRNLEHISQLL